ncbi:MAG: hypothetical protein AAF438_03130 [Pseudomonadota bacterium]
MERVAKICGFFTLYTLLIGCVQTQPLMSHAHVGHALTGWHDTPGQKGLFLVAEEELAIAVVESRSAWQSVRDAKARVQHLENALNALNPDLQPVGTGAGYGAIRALEGAIDHMEFAASSDDASDNFVASVIGISGFGDRVLERLKQAQNLAAQAIKHEQPSDHLTREVYAMIKSAYRGEDTDGDGRIDGGVLMLRDHLQAMLDREQNPRYEPVSRRYVLGLIRLPNGKWGYRLPKRDRSAVVYSGY